ncbi:Cyclin, N-terminal domain [Popillia japonica]|uniref:Cyclin, N-terminal domain n=1 Tax=Popillia japonica TaxID=7064 RepID=A0AAW1LR09_POPJA
MCECFERIPVHIKGPLKDGTNKNNAANITNIAKDARGKRKADGSPTKENGVKRSAFCDVTNAIAKVKNIDEKVKILTKNHMIVKKVTIHQKTLPTVKTIVKSKQNENLAPPPAPGKVQTRASCRNVVPNQTAQKPKDVQKENVTTKKVKTRLSNEFEKTTESLYSTALEEMNVSHSSSTSKYSSTKSSPVICGSSDVQEQSSITLVVDQMEKQLTLGNQEVPENVNDFDKENWDDIFQVSHYAMDIFNYLKTRETTFAISDYMERQVCLTKWMRQLLVDWMVEVQESFELNHETLYLGVKLVDIYLSKMTVGKETLQLVGAAAMFVASKYDERIPPMVEDFLYICDGAYNRKELLRMEINLLKVCDFDLGIPLSYRFLRRYARCAKVTMPILTLARYVLENSLMEYETVALSDSILASASLYLALQMKKTGGWTETLEFYTGYTYEEILPTVHLLNSSLHKKPKEQTMTVHNKYSHKVFFEVAKTPLISNEDLKP